MNVVRAEVGIQQFHRSWLDQEDMRHKLAMFLIHSRLREIECLAAGDVIEPHHSLRHSPLLDFHGIYLFGLSTVGHILCYREHLRSDRLSAVQNLAGNRTAARHLCNAIANRGSGGDGANAVRNQSWQENESKPCEQKKSEDFGIAFVCHVRSSWRRWVHISNRNFPCSSQQLPHYTIQDLGDHCQSLRR